MVYSYCHLFPQSFPLWPTSLLCSHSPEDGDIDLNTGRVVVLKPSTHVEEAWQQQVNGRHQCRHEEQLLRVLESPFLDSHLCMNGRTRVRAAVPPTVTIFHSPARLDELCLKYEEGEEKICSGNRMMVLRALLKTFSFVFGTLRQKFHF